MKCLDEASALAILDQGIPPTQREALDLHLDSCESCRRLVAEIARGSAPSSPGEVELALGASVGRFTIEHELGRGTMGVVYAAYDPELDRRIALKLFRRTGDPTEEHELEERLLQEARTMARLAHPNVVPVYEVARCDGGLFLAMELVEGDTLREWLGERPRAPSVVVAVLAGAGAGLAAAHAAGLVHRDFKPENVLVGADGRARVTDFGLARHVALADGPADAPTSMLTQTGALVGTPAYMAPEQIEGRVVDAKTDQFSFCVVLHEALCGERPFTGVTLAELSAAIRRGELRRRTSRRLHRVLARGLAAEPAARFPAMEALVAHLAPRSRARVVAAAAVVAAAGIAIAAFARPVPAQVCTHGADELAGVWDGARRGAVAIAFGQASGSFARTAAELDRYAASWVDTAAASCEATRVRGEASDAMLDRRAACLADRRDDLRALVDLFATADARTIEHAPTAVTALAPPSTCWSPDAADADPPAASGSRAIVRRATALSELGRNKEAIAALDPVIAGASAFPRLHADALYARGAARLALREDKHAAADLEDAAYAALAIKSDELAARAGSLLIVAETDAGDLAKARDSLRYARAAVARLGGERGEPGELAAHVAWLELHEGKLADAEAEAREAVEIGCRGAPARTVRCAHLDVLATALFSEGKLADALAAYRDTTALAIAQLGPDHPDIAYALEHEGNALEKLGRHGEALDRYDRAAAIYRKSADGGEGRLASLLDNSGTTLMSLGRNADAEARMRQALALHERVQGADHQDVAITLVNLGNVLALEGKNAEAEALRRRSLAILEKRLGPNHPLVAATLVQLARQLVVDHRPREAEPMLERAAAIQNDDPYTLDVLGSAQLDADEPGKAAATLGRALAAKPDPDLAVDIEANLADALWRSGDRARARSVANQALAARPGDADLARWLDRHR